MWGKFLWDGINQDKEYLMKNFFASNILFKVQYKKNNLKNIFW